MSNESPAPHSARRGIIDLHSHWLSPRAVARLSRRNSPPHFVATAGGYVAHTGQAALGVGLPLGNHWFDIDYRIAHLDATGVSHQLISWPTTLGFDPVLTPQESLPLWAEYNDDLAGVIASHRDRLSGVAVLSTADIAWSARELARAHDELGLIGAVLPVNVFSSLEAARHFAPVFEVAQRYGSHVYLHTGFGHPSVTGQPPATTFADVPLIRWVADSAWHFASALITLAFTDFLKPYPNVSVQVAMLGGSGLAALVAEQLQVNSERYQIPDVRARFEQIWLDTGALGGGTEAVTATANVLGADRVVFGSDFAPQPSIAPVIERVEAARLSPLDKDLIFRRNAHQLLASRGVTLPTRLMDAIAA